MFIKSLLSSSIRLEGGVWHLLRAVVLSGVAMPLFSRAIDLVPLDMLDLRASSVGSWAETTMEDSS